MRRWLLLAVLLFARPAIAAPDDVWAIDPRASTLAFTASQVGAFVNGRFPAWTGEIFLDPSALTAARIDIRIQTPAATTSSRDIDSLLRGASFLDVQRFPEARFIANSVVRAGGDRYEARGKLTIRDVTRDAVLPFTLTLTDDPSRPGSLRATARGRLLIKRLDYGVGQGEWSATGQVADDVTIDVSVVASRPK